MKTHTFTLLSLLLLAPLAAAEVRPAKPNIILILADDLGYGDLGCYGGKLVPTPALDSLAGGGVRCTDGYVTAPLCAPSRCGLMTGAYQQRFGIQWNTDSKFYSVGKHQLLPRALKAAGYSTGHIGKWNIASEVTSCFDKTYDVVNWEADFFPGPDGRYVGVDDPVKQDSSKKNGLWGTLKPGEEYLTDRMGRHAVEFIEEHKAEPFFLFLAFNAPHSPLQAKAGDRGRFGDIKPEPLNLYAAMLASLDENIGRVLEKLKTSGIEENTIVVFVSDNGPASMPTQIWPEDWPQERMIVGSAGPLGGHKAKFLEGGIRTPFIVRWPSLLEAGSTYGQPVSTMDFYATLCAAAGAAVPPDTKLDGVNLLPYLRGEQAGAPHRILFWKNREQGAVREGDWKLLMAESKPQLFNLASDPAEQRDLAGEKPEIVARLQQAWQDWSATLPPAGKPESDTASKAGVKLDQDRAALFAKKDKSHDSKLSPGEFIANQPDAEAAKLRFVQLDKDQDGFLSADEFIKAGGKSK